MRILQVIAATLAVPFVVCVNAAAQPDEVAGIKDETRSSVQKTDSPIIDEIAFTGLRHIAPQAVLAQIVTRTGEPLDLRQLADDVHRLGRLGWFSSVRVEAGSVEDGIGEDGENSEHIRLSFCVVENAFLTGLEYGGSRLLSQHQIEKLLEEKKVAVKTGEPENPATLNRAASAIRLALAALGHPEASVRMRRTESTNATVRVQFEISDGPHLRVSQVAFAGEPGLPPKILRRQMERLRPDALFAGLRGKDVYTEEGFQEDRQRLVAYYRNHGHPEARIGASQVSRVEGISRQWLPWPRKRRETQLHVVVPVEAGPFYRIESINVSAALQGAAATARNRAPEIPAAAKPGRPDSAQAIEALRRAWQAKVQPKKTVVRDDPGSFVNVEVNRTLDPASHSVSIRLNQSTKPPYTVRSLEFRGIHRFPDRYLRSRIPLQEGAVFDDRALEAGLARLARTTYFKPIKKEDVQVVADELTHTVDMTIRIEELGQQRASLAGGRGQFGSTLGILYTVFNLFHGEELLSSQIEGGPESLQLAIGFAKEGFLGSRGSLALSVFNTLLRPRLSAGTKGPFFKQESEGVNATWSYALTKVDALNVSYNLTRAKTQYSPIVPQGVTDLTLSDVQTETASHAIGLGWTHDCSAQRIVLADSVSGGWLGGSENLVRSRAEYGRIWRNTILDRQNAWAFRTSWSGIGSYSGELPPYARSFAGDEFVRGLRPGELGPQAEISSLSPSGATKYSATPAGADLVGAANLEYRIRLSGSTEAAEFFDAGSGLLLPNWLGRARPALIDSTNRLLYASTGIQMQLTVPGIGVPVRAYYALNLLRLDRWLPMQDGSLFHAHDRFSAFGWGLSPMF